MRSAKQKDVASVSSADLVPLKRPLRVAYCITELEPGGAERALVELVTRLDRRRFEPAVYVLAARPAAPRDVLARRLDEAGIPLHFLDARYAWQAPRVIARLADEWRRYAPDVVHSYLFHANIVARLAATRMRVPRTICGIRVAEHRARWHRRLDRWTQRRVSKFVCVSQSVADFSRDVTGLDASKLVVIPNGVDVAKLTARASREPSELGLPSGRRFLVCVGRLDEQKGVDRLVDVAPRLLAELPEHDLVLVGDGPRRGEIERRVASERLSSRVHLMGWRDDAVDFIAAADLLLLPSRWEGMPNVVLEAMALRRPVVASDVEGVREVLGAYAGPQVAPRDDMNAFVGATIALARQLTATAEIGAANHARACADFSWERVVDRHAALYLS